MMWDKSIDGDPYQPRAAGMKCQRCGLPQLSGVVGYAGPACKCWMTFSPAPPGNGCQPLRQLTEADVRRIVREELARQAPPTELRQDETGEWS